MLGPPSGRRACNALIECRRQPPTAPTPPLLLQALFYDFITALAVHTNPFTGLAFRDDPSVLGWDLLSGARDPRSRGEELQASGCGGPNTHSCDGGTFGGVNSLHDL